MRKYFFILLLAVCQIAAQAQVINVTGVSTTGRFNSCGAGSLPVITATLISSDGSSISGNTLVCNDICGTTVLRVNLSNVQWNQTPGANWIHGLFFPTNAGVTISAIMMPAGWSSFASCTGAACSAGQTGGQGFYFDGTSANSCCTGAAVMDGIANNNYGDISIDCGAAFAFQFDMSFCNKEITGGILNFQLTGTADGNTGCWSTDDALVNTVNFSIATQACPPINNVPFTSSIIRDCSVSPANYYAVMSGGCGNGNTVTWWDAPVGGTQLGSGNGFIYDPPGSTCPAGTTLYASCCPASVSNCIERTAVTITGTCPPAPLSVFAQTNLKCSEIDDGIISITPSSSGPYNVTLSGPGGPYVQNNAAAPITFTGLSAGTYNYSFVDANGCVGTGGPVVLTKSPPINSPAVLVKPTCHSLSNGKVTINARGGRPPYQYSDDGGITYQAGNLFTGLAAGPHTFRIKDDYGCIKDTTIILPEPNLLGANILSTTAAGCGDRDGIISMTGTGGTTAYKYSIVSGPVINNTGLNSGTFTGLAKGLYQLKVTDANLCTYLIDANVGHRDNMFLSLDPQALICTGSSFTMQPQTNPETDQFRWHSINAPVTSIADTTIKNAVVSPVDTSTYVLHATWGICERWDTITVNVLHKPIAHAGEDTAICYRTTATFNGYATNTSGPVIFTWTPLSYLSTPQQGVTSVSPPDAGTYQYTLSVQDDYGCNFLTTDIIKVIVTPPVPVYAGRDTIAVSGVPHQLYGSGGVQYTWAPAAGLNGASYQNPLATIYDDTRFTLEVMDIAGCKGWDTVFVKVYEGPTYYVPNAFTPNGDGRNDVFRPVPVGIVSTEYFRVFDRYGKMVFETKEWLKGWDGRFLGRKQPISTYVWMIKGTDKNGKTVQQKGTVTLLQ